MNKSFFIHIDADAFFASVEQCLHRELRGKPVVTGRDGAMAIAMSYEAKSLGVERATPIHIIRKEFPTVHMVASDYFMYRIFSQRMLEIIREHIPNISRKSIDECSADITELVHSFSQADILAQKIKQDLELKLQCNFSVGISSSELLAKMASGMNKPSGLTIINVLKDGSYLNQPIKKVSGLGKKLCQRLSGLGIIRIRDFIENYPSIAKNFSVITNDIYQQLCGNQSTRCIPETLGQSMNRARSFRVSNNKSEILGQLIINLDTLLKKMRLGNIRCKRIHISMRNAQRESFSLGIKLHAVTRDREILHHHSILLLNELFNQNDSYRYVSVTLSGLQHGESLQADLFGESITENNNEKLFALMDILDTKFGKQCLVSANTLLRPKNLGSHINRNNNPITEMHTLLPKETFFRRLDYPYMGSIN